VAAAQGTIFWDGEPLIETSELGIPGEHNVENAMAAAAAALSFGIDRDAVVAGLRGFAGVPHRLEPVAESDGVRFVNDSKATNVASAAVGIGSFDRGVHAILGGSDKGEPFGPLLMPLRERAVACYLLGDTAPRMAAELAPLADAGVPLRRVADLEEAVRTAAAAAAPGEVVLLSPACASFDAFPNFEARGERFRQIVAALGAERG
jgi:UDP-N-acetylmuramoylalanine--D-glutamate ligase